MRWWLDFPFCCTAAETHTYSFSLSLAHTNTLLLHGHCGPSDGLFTSYFQSFRPQDSSSAYIISALSFFFSISEFDVKFLILDPGTICCAFQSLRIFLTIFLCLSQLVMLPAMFVGGTLGAGNSNFCPTWCEPDLKSSRVANWLVLWAGFVLWAS